MIRIVLLICVLAAAIGPVPGGDNMANLFSNGGFLENLNDWTPIGNQTTWESRYYYETYGSARMDASSGFDQLLRQDISVPSGTGYAVYRLQFALLSTKTAQEILITLLDQTLSGHIFLDYPIDLTGNVEEWDLFTFDVLLAYGHDYRFEFELTSTPDDPVVYVDDVSLEYLSSASNICRSLALELQKTRRDLAGQKHSQERYHSVVNQAIREVPIALWQQDVDTSLTTVEEQRRYSLAGISAITETRQVRNVHLEDADGHYYEIGRWRVENDLGTLTLILDRDPPDESRTIRIEYVRPFDELDCSDDTDSTELDHDWLIAKAMTLLLMEADPGLEDPALLARELTIWDQKRAARERQIEVRRPAKKARSSPGPRWG